MTETRNQTPKDIDHQLSDLMQARYELQAQAAQLVKRQQNLQKTVDAPKPYENVEQAQKQIAADQVKYDAIQVQITENLVAAELLNEEFNRRGGWTRAFLVVTSGKGHIHTSTACHTCYPTTHFYWLWEVSGDDEATIVDQAGDGACTVCYPTAPVAVVPGFKKKTTFMTPEQAAYRAEKATKDAAKATKALLTGITDVDGSELRAYESSMKRVNGELIDFVRLGNLVKTARAATNQISGDAQSLAWYGADHPSAPAWRANVQHLATAVAHRNGLELGSYLVEIAAKVSKKVTKDGVARTPVEVFNLIREGL